MFRIARNERKAVRDGGCGDGKRAIRMIADFDRSLREHGPSFYRHLFWESGVVGQVLYLEAEEQYCLQSLLLQMMLLCCLMYLLLLLLEYTYHLVKMTHSR